MNQANGGNVIYKFLGDDKQLQKTLGGVKSALGGAGSMLKGVGGAVAGITVAAGAALTALTATSVKAYADLEQSLGGTETLFKESSDKVIQNAKNAYKTAGTDANTYLENVNSFAAGLLKSVDNNAEKAADIADMAFRDMSDNANKFGTNMESITHAYQGFAKQNYTMLDNLKLGYGGTTDEMKRLLRDAEKLTGLKYDISNLSDVYNAIHVIQDQLGITGTTAKESMNTVSGSVNTAKAAIQNFLSGAGGFEEVVDSVVVAGTQIGRAVTEMLPKIVDGIVGIVNGLIPELPGLIQKLLPVILQGTVDLIRGLVAALPDLIKVLAEMLPTIIEQLIQALTDVANALAEMMPTLVPLIVNALIEGLLAIFNNIDTFIEACLALIIGLAEGLIQALPILIERLPEMIDSILTALIDLYPMIIEAGWKLIPQLVIGIVKAIPQITNVFGTLIHDTIPNALAKGAVKLWETGKNIIKGIWNGIKSFDIVGAIKKLAKDMLKGMMNVLGIHSPSTAFAWLGKQSMLGYTNQLEDMKGMLDNVIEDTFSLNPQLATGDLHYSPNVVVNNNISSSTDSLGQTVTNIKTFANGAKNDYNYGMGVA